MIHFLLTIFFLCWGWNILKRIVRGKRKPDPTLGGRIVNVRTQEQTDAFMRAAKERHDTFAARHTLDFSAPAPPAPKPNNAKKLAMYWPKDIEMPECMKMSQTIGVKP